MPFALLAEETDTLGGVPAAFISQLYTHVPLDGADPPNTDPREGLADPDGDGIANFVDPDNDGDALDDATELANGTDINLANPRVTGTSPSLARNDQPQTITILGFGFEPGLIVVVGAQSPAPSNVTSTSFDVVVGPQPDGLVDVSVTNANGLSDVLPDGLEFVPPAPVVFAIDPSSERACQTTTVSFDGLFFDPGLTVTFGSESPAPQNQSSTHFEVEVGPQAPDSAAIELTNPNQLTTSSSFDFVDVVPQIDGFLPPDADFDATTTVEIQGSSFEPGIAVAFGAETPTPANVTPTSLEVTVGPQPAGIKTVTLTNECGEQASAPFNFASGKTVFVTSQSYDGDLGGLAGADAKCATLAAAAGWSGTFLAWLSDGIDDPDTRFSRIGPFARSDGLLVANDWLDLTDGSLIRRIILDENGDAATAANVHTNVAADGTSLGPDHCAGWTSSSSGSTDHGGNTLWLDARWTNRTVLDSCDSPERLYCFEQ